MKLKISKKQLRFLKQYVHNLIRRNIRMWDYRCPQCYTVYINKIRHCQCCGNKFNDGKWRIPPRYLHNKKLFRKEIFRSVTPKLSRFQVCLIRLFYTEHINDGFESEDLSAWTGTQISGGCSIAADNSDITANEGSWVAKCVTDGDDEYANVYYDMGTGAYPHYARCYVQFPILPENGKCFCFIVLEETGVRRACSAFLENNGGTQEWHAVGYLGGAWKEVNYTGVEPIVDTWFCVEIGYGAGAGPYTVELWIDGNLTTSATGWGPDDADVARFGHNLATGGGEPTRDAGTLYVDSCIFADAEIGEVEAGGDSLSQSVTDTITISDSLPKSMIKSLTEALTISETNPKGAMKQLEDTLTISDSKFKGFIKTLSDTLTISDSTNLLSRILQTVTDTLTISDNFRKNLTKSITDTLTISDTTTKNIVKVLQDAITFTDSFVKTLGGALSQSVTDTITITDNFVKNTVKVVSDSLSISESTPKIVIKIINDALTIADTVSASILGVFEGAKIVLTFQRRKITLTTLRRKIRLLFKR